MEEISSITSIGNHDEVSYLLPGRRRSWLAMRYGNTRKCVSNKAALLILLWSFVVGLLRVMLLYTKVYLSIVVHITIFIGYGMTVVFTCFLPLAGILADIRFGRYKTIVNSLSLVLIAVFLAPGVAAIVTFSIIYWWSLATLIVLCLLGGILFLILYVGLTGFISNAIQFGMDQLYDSPAEDSTLFIHWYVWTFNASFLIVKIAWDLGINKDIEYGLIGYCLLALILVVVGIVLAITLCLVRRRRRWFLIEPGGLNPYKLVYRVTKFAHQHKIPVQCSAFTYCEDELPSGLDLGKEKYGGCFTTEQVENVKAFYGILKVLFSVGMVFFMDVVIFGLYTRNTPLRDIEYYFLNSGLLSFLLTVICIPLYLCLLRPFISQYIPGMLKRMRLGMLLVLLSLLTSFFMDTVTQLEDDLNNNTYCMFEEVDYLSHQNPALLLIHVILTSLSNMLIYTEFICSQSPHSMKGLLMCPMPSEDSINSWPLFLCYPLPFFQFTPSPVGFGTTS